MDETTNFDVIIKEIGNDGKFQRRFNFLYNFLLVIFASMPHLNVIFALAVPNHWCHVPGREANNFSIEEWKELHIPKVYDNNGLASFDKCTMFDGNSSQIIGCKYGWEYDKQWYDLTAPSQEDWVCDKKLYVTNAFALSRVGEVFGTLIFGQLADSYGRKPVFFASIITILIGKLLFAFSAHYLVIFFLSVFIANLPSTSVFQGPLIIAMEVSKTERRAHIAMLQCIGWTLGLVLMSLLIWITRRWDIFIIITTAPLAAFLFSRSLIIESPRWLSTKCKTERCVKELEKICKRNKSEMPKNIFQLLEKNKSCQQMEKTHYTILSLFSSWRLAKNTIIIIISWSILLLVYSVLTLNIDNLQGNPFMNFLLQSTSELPAYVLGKYLSDYVGRRWTTILSFVLSTIGLIPIIFLVEGEGNALLISGVSIFVKFSVSLAFYSVNLQAIEIYPTCVRQTGISVGTIFGATFGILAPYVVYMGTNYKASFPYILLSGLTIVAIFCSCFLPETLNKKLPETLKEASQFGKYQNLCGVEPEEKLRADDIIEGKPLK